MCSCGITIAWAFEWVEWPSTLVKASLQVDGRLNWNVLNQRGIGFLFFPKPYFKRNFPSMGIWTSAVLHYVTAIWERTINSNSLNLSFGSELPIPVPLPVGYFSAMPFFQKLALVNFGPILTNELDEWGCEWRWVRVRRIDRYSYSIALSLE